MGRCGQRPLRVRGIKMEEGERRVGCAGDRNDEITDNIE